MVLAFDFIRSCLLKLRKGRERERIEGRRKKKERRRRKEGGGLSNFASSVWHQTNPLRLLSSPV
jgi:hypothetical protein